MDYRKKQRSASGNSKLSAVHFISQVSNTSFTFNIAGIFILQLCCGQADKVFAL